ncbi:MAG: type II toxin-antitoxin system VapC family toxin [archaeon GB-1867-035]|nr:type II toxin-antitoxin system VapC family toxin [Candidatus Culexmicrobium profundum]
MREVAVDASIIVKWFVIEENSDKALELRDKYVEGEIRIIAPELITFEILNALKYKELFNEEELKEISEALQAYSFSLYPLKGEYARKTVEVAVKNNITIYDASYVALAIMRKTQMYTADEKLIKKLRKKYLKYVKSIQEI